MKWLNSFRLQLFGVALILIIMLAVSIVFGLQTATNAANSQATVNLIGQQRSNALLMDRNLDLLELPLDDEERVNLTNLVRSLVANFEQGQIALRSGDAVLGIDPITNPAALSVFDELDARWQDYRTTVATGLELDPEALEELDPTIDSQSVGVFTFADRLARAMNTLAEQEIANARNLAIGIFVITLLFLIASIITVNNTVRALNRLTTAADQLRRGDLNTRVEVGRVDELVVVGNTFNEMAHAIQQREGELSDLNRQLEARVEERTIELKLARDEALAAQQVALDNSRLKSEFLSTMSHELRTPLNAIEGFTSIMLSGMGIELSPRAEDMVQRVSANSKRLLYLINDFLDLSRIESGRLELVKSPISPQAMAQKWKREVGVLAEKKGLDFVVTIDPDLPATLLADEDALSKITVNLLSNAFKFTHQGKVTLDLKRRDNNWLIIVSDTGIGIPSHAREYIFDEFRQVDGSSKRLYGGTGLGLSLVQKLARAMGGSVLLQSEMGQGSTFTVSLPLEVTADKEGVVA